MMARLGWSCKRAYTNNSPAILSRLTVIFSRSEAVFFSSGGKPNLLNAVELFRLRALIWRYTCQNYATVFLMSDLALDLASKRMISMFLTVSRVFQRPSSHLDPVST